MYLFPQSVNPAVRSHMDAQVAYLNALSQTMSHSFQQMFQLNMQLGQTLIEEATGAAQRMLASERPTDALSAAASRAQPASDKLRAYQQQLSQLAATTQVDLNSVTEQHAQETSRTARALAEDVTRAAAEETDKGLHQQEEAVKNARDGFRQESERGVQAGARFQGNLQSSLDSAGGQPDDQAGSPVVPGNMQGGKIDGSNKIPTR